MNAKKELDRQNINVFDAKIDIHEANRRKLLKTLEMKPITKKFYNVCPGSLSKPVKTILDSSSTFKRAFPEKHDKEN